MNPVQNAMYSLVQDFVERQKLVYDVIEAFRPHLVKKDVRWPGKEFLRATFRGHWGTNQEWEYAMHGGGCRLTHTITLEVIEWDSPDLLRLDPYWFTNWVEWFLHNHPDDSRAQIIMPFAENNNDELRVFVFEILVQLTGLEMLRYHPDTTNMYELVVG